LTSEAAVIRPLHSFNGIHTSPERGTMLPMCPVRSVTYVSDRSSLFAKPEGFRRAPPVVRQPRGGRSRPDQKATIRLNSRLCSTSSMTDQNAKGHTMGQAAHHFLFSKPGAVFAGSLGTTWASRASSCRQKAVTGPKECCSAERPAPNRARPRRRWSKLSPL